jgi:hypothetical protein
MSGAEFGGDAYGDVAVAEAAEVGRASCSKGYTSQGTYVMVLPYPRV